MGTLSIPYIDTHLGMNDLLVYSLPSMYTSAISSLFALKGTCLPIDVFLLLTSPNLLFRPFTDMIYAKREEKRAEKKD